jgi:hypothetical protein
MLFPPVLGWAVVLSRDVWYGTMLLAAAAALRFLMFDSGGKAARIAAWAAAGAGILMAAAVRQNGIVGLLPVLALAAWLLVDELSSARRLTVRVAYTAFATLTAAFLTLGVVRLLTYQVIDAHRTHIDQALYIYDLAAVSERSGEYLFSPRTLPKAEFGSLVRAFDPDNVDSILWGPDAFFDLGSSDTAALRSEWIDLLREHPLDYARARAHLFARMLAVPPAEPVWTYQPTSASRALASEAFGLPNRAVDRYLREFSTSFLQRPFLYLVPILLFLVLAAPSSPKYRFVAAIALGALLSELSFFFLSTVVGTRYSWIMIVMGVVTAASSIQLLVARRQHGLRGRRAAKPIASPG